MASELELQYLLFYVISFKSDNTKPNNIKL